MEVILRQAVDSLGHAGDLVKVSTGFARNYLLPRGMALPATDGNKKRITMEKAKLIAAEQGRVDAAQEMAKAYADLSITLRRASARKASSSGRSRPATLPTS